MVNLERDITATKNFISNIEYRMDDYNLLYRHTNEKLDSIFSQYDFKGKNVLSVLASSDQMFSAYYLGASNVDTFDCNILTYYYFFLRKWCLLYTNNYQLSKSNSELLKAIELYDKNDPEEENAYMFWKTILLWIDKELYNSNLFFYSVNIYSVPFSTDISKMKKIIKSKKPNFKHLNIFEPIRKTMNKYEIIILSNILEYLYNNYIDTISITNACRNLSNLISDDGIIISSNIQFGDIGNNAVFNRYFEYDESPIIHHDIPINFTYKKKKHL